MWYGWRRKEMCTDFSFGERKEWGLLGRPRDRREDDIKMDLKEIGLEHVDCINLADMDKL
jgi:hypothetical protein